MNGTEWTEPGQGATALEIHDAYQEREICFEPEEFLDAFEKAFPPNSDWKKRTNLRLTGAPLTADDVANIGRAK